MLGVKDEEVALMLAKHMKRANDLYLEGMVRDRSHEIVSLDGAVSFLRTLGRRPIVKKDKSLKWRYASVEFGTYRCDISKDVEPIVKTIPNRQEVEEFPIPFEMVVENINVRLNRYNVFVWEQSDKLTNMRKKLTGMFQLLEDIGHPCKVEMQNGFYVAFELDGKRFVPKATAQEV